MFKPSAYAAISAYSTPLWTIFTKCPAPLGPQWRYPYSAVLGAPSRPGVRGDCPKTRRERAKDRVEALHRVSVSADHQAVAALQAPYSAAGPGVHVVDT